MISYRLSEEPGESLPAGLRRIAREQLDEALAQLGGRAEAGADERIHEARKAFKQVRAVIRLVRDEVGSDLYAEVNKTLRDAGRELAELRDAAVLVETLESVASGEIEPERLDPALKPLRADHHRLRGVVFGGDLLDSLRAEIRRQRHRIDAWPIDRADSAAFAEGLLRVYARGRDAIAEAAAERGVEALHEWRKRVKYLWYQARILEPAAPGTIGELVEWTDELADLLGLDHDHAVLARRLEDDPELALEPGVARRVTELIDDRRAELQRRAFELAERVYVEEPEDFTERIATQFDRWRAELGGDELPRRGTGIEPGEASGLCPLGSSAVLAARGWELGLWAALDDTSLDRAIVAVGRPRDNGDRTEWEAARLECRAADGADDALAATDDAEDILRSGGWIYAVGSHYGSKEGPLERERAFVARFREDEAFGSEASTVELAGREFELHRLINDALEEAGIELWDLDGEAREALVGGAIAAGVADEAKWVSRLQPTDQPINIEGVAASAEGTVLIGLRYPVSADGHPILIELDSLDAMFDPDGPEVRSICVVEEIGNPEVPAGFRGLAEGEKPGELHALLGNLDSTGKGSVVVDRHPEAGLARSTHMVVKLGEASAEPPRRPASAELIREFPGLLRVEGIAVAPDEGTFYVIDESDRVALLRG